MLLPPKGEAGEVACRVLQSAGIECVLYEDVNSLTRALPGGVGVVLLWEEAIGAGRYGGLAEFISRQPPWSDLPILVLTHSSADSPAILQALELLGNVTLLERTTRFASLVTAVRTALRARERQYQIREHLSERERVTHALAEADRRKDEFLATLAHELRNPLAPITNSIHLLRLLSSGQTESRQLSEILERQVSHMVRLVDDLMELSRITRGLMELRVMRLDLASVIRNAVEASRPLVELGNHTLQVSVPEQMLPLEGDAVRLAQVFANLLNNAAKYTDRGGHIWLSAIREADWAVVSVRDDGLGIAPDMLPRVFEMFTQADRAGLRAQSGLGIGLTLVKSLVELHGGRVLALSEGLGMGSEFIVRLPLVRVGAPAPEIPVYEEPPRLAGLRILVADDSRDGAESLALLLRHLGAEVRIAHNGPEALEALPEFRPEVAVLDIGMPGMTGFEVARRIRIRPEYAGMTLIALTGWGQEADKSRTRSAGFDHHLIKPADLDTLKQLLTSLLPTAQ